MSIFNFSKETTHVGFADEAYWNRGEFRAVACVSARVDDYHEIEKRLCGSRCAAGAIASEIKWSGVRTRYRQRDADAALQTILELATERKLRLDVLVWDKRARDFLDQTFGIRQNRALMHLQIMYRSLFSQVVSRWRSDEGTSAPYWTFAPDRHDGIDFPIMQRDIRREVILSHGSLIDVKDVKESLNYSIQLADLLAGMSAYSHENWEDFEIWLGQDKSHDQNLYASQWRTRFPILDRFTRLCQGKELGPTLLSPIPAFAGRGLWTPEFTLTQHTVNIQPFAPLP